MSAKWLVGFFTFAIAGQILAADFSGQYTGPNLSVDLSPASDGYSGKIKLGAQQFPVQAHEQDGQLHGSFSSNGHDFEFTASLSGDRMTLISGGATYTMQKASAGPANPLAQAAPNPLATDAPAGYTVVNSTDAGKAFSADKPNAASVRAALSSTAADMEKFFDGKPKFLGAYEDAKDHRTGGASFTASKNGQPIKGVVSCKMTDKGSSVSLIYARADVSVDQWNKLIGANAAAPAAPQVQLNELRFPDGSGSIGIAEGYKTASQTAAQTIIITGADDQVVTIGFCVSVSTPNSMAVQLQRQYGGPAGARMLVAPFTAPEDALKNLVPQLSRISQQSGGPAVQLDKILFAKDIQAMAPNGRAQFLQYTVTRTTNGVAQHHRALAKAECTPLGQEAWMLYMIECASPEQSFDHDLPIMLAMVNSLKSNDAVIQQRTQQNIDASNQRFAAMQKANRDLQASYDSYNKSVEHNSLLTARSNTDFDEVIRGYRTVEDTKTGERSSVDLGNVDNVVDKLNEADPGRYKQIPLRDETYPLNGN